MFKFIYVFGMNPAITLPNQNLLRQGFCRDDVYVVVHDTNWTETADFADIVLPAQNYLEKEDVVIPWAHGLVRKSNRATDPLEESRHEIDVMTAIAERIGIQEQWVFEDPWNALEKACENTFADGTFKDLVSGKTLTLKYPPLNKYPTTTGRIEFYSKEAEANGHNPIPDAFPVDVAQGEYLLLNSAIPSYTHSQFQESYGPVPSLVWINPKDASRLGVDNEQAVFLFNDTGETAGKAEITDRVPEGILWAPHEFVGMDGNFQNSITQSSTQRIGGGSVFNSTVVKIRLESGTQ
jgi:anaerobic selenocysteine-containing dehydrogenase